MLVCKCGAIVEEGSPELKICPYCGNPDLSFEKVAKKKEVVDEKKTS